MAAPEAVALDRSAYVCIRDLKTLEDWVARATAQGWVAVDTETDALDSVGGGLVGVSLALAPGEACYIPLAHVDPDVAAGGGDMFGADPPRQIRMTEAIKVLKPMLEDAAVLKIGQNIKYDLSVFKRQGIRVAPIDDTMLISFALNAGIHNHGMDELSELLSRPQADLVQGGDRQRQDRRSRSRRCRSTRRPTTPPRMPT